MSDLDLIIARLKCGEYDGADLMKAWINLRRIAELEERITELEGAIKYATEYGEVAFLGVNMPFKAFKRLKEVLKKDK